MSVGTVAIVVTDDNAPTLWDVYEVGLACVVFGVEYPDLADPWYEMRLCGTRPDLPRASRGFVLNPEHGLEGLHGANTILVPSVPETVLHGTEPLDPLLVKELQAAADSGARIAALCNGAFVLAEAGLLDGRRATAHWSYTAELARRYPKVEVDDSVLYIDEGQILTSAGAAAGLDLCLYLVRQDLGAHVANQLARRLCVPAHRTGGQAQFVTRHVPATDDDSIAPVLEWATHHLDRPLTVAELARRAGMSQRTFFRRLHEATGTTPLQWLLSQRLAHAQALLETTALSVEQVGERCGLGSGANLRRHFTAHVGIAPTDYRRAFTA
ncbi:helix-turn-helix domain-containing protein [Crossiella cryophila]|uniref:Transcriptional regulator GlxA family with amidase domain n=1 Tax=Crossiella cryophila TaxID=43355 RepID=A0A7W7CGF4_9PSEU|nr:helix-turn-helix domain-containing protein [Crossiella cryophila]MBB4679308.1 transcriptional regulator GlxA family with amidase domain [Crossiella cryophila]